MKKLNVNQMKYLAAGFMVVDSVFLAFPGVFPAWFHLITRFVAPLFAFFLVEGFFHTKNQVRYMKRLWIAALLMQVGDFLSLLLLGSKHQITDNIFLTLAIGFTMIYLLETGKKATGKHKVFCILGGILLLLFGFVFSILPIPLGNYYFGLEGGMQILAVILIFYLFYGNRKKQVLVFLLWNALFLAFVGIPLPGDYESLSIWFSDFSYNSDALTFLFLPFLLLYNGQKGQKGKFHRNFFYVFYPAHLWILAIIARLTMGK